MVHFLHHLPTSIRKYLKEEKREPPKPPSGGPPVKSWKMGETDWNLESEKTLLRWKPWEIGSGKIGDRSRSPQELRRAAESYSLIVRGRTRSEVVAAYRGAAKGDRENLERTLSAISQSW